MTEITATSTVEHTDRCPSSKNEIAEAIAADIPIGSYVNLGIGQPTAVGNYLTAESGVILHTENGMLNTGREAVGEIDPDLINAGKIPVIELPGTAYFHHADSFAMMRGGHLDVCVLGAYQVSEYGDLAKLVHRCAGRDPRSRRSDGPGDRGQGRVGDDDSLHQVRRGQDRAELQLSSHRHELREPGLQRRGHVVGRAGTRDRDRDFRGVLGRSPGASEDRAASAGRAVIRSRSLRSPCHQFLAASLLCRRMVDQQTQRQADRRRSSRNSETGSAE
jgi:hypothetical protein